MGINADQARTRARGGTVVVVAAIQLRPFPRDGIQEKYFIRHGLILCSTTKQEYPRVVEHAGHVQTAGTGTRARGGLPFPTFRDCIQQPNVIVAAVIVQ